MTTLFSRAVQLASPNVSGTDTITALVWSRQAFCSITPNHISSAGCGLTAPMLQIAKRSDTFQFISSLTLKGESVDDDCVQFAVDGVFHLQKIELVGCSVTDDVARVLLRVRSLDEVVFDSCKALSANCLVDLLRHSSESVRACIAVALCRFCTPPSEGRFGMIRQNTNNFAANNNAAAQLSPREQALEAGAFAALVSALKLRFQKTSSWAAYLKALCYICEDPSYSAAAAPPAALPQPQLAQPPPLQPPLLFAHRRRFQHAPLAAVQPPQIVVNGPAAAATTVSAVQITISDVASCVEPLREFMNCNSDQLRRAASSLLLILCRRRRDMVLFALDSGLYFLILSQIKDKVQHPCVMRVLDNAFRVLYEHNESERLRVLLDRGLLTFLATLLRDKNITESVAQRIEAWNVVAAISLHFKHEVRRSGLIALAIDTAGEDLDCDEVVSAVGAFLYLKPIRCDAPLTFSASGFSSPLFLCASTRAWEADQATVREQLESVREQALTFFAYAQQRGGMEMCFSFLGSLAPGEQDFRLQAAASVLRGLVSICEIEGPEPSSSFNHLSESGRITQPQCAVGQHDGNGSVSGMLRRRERAQSSEAIAFQRAPAERRSRVGNFATAQTNDGNNDDDDNDGNGESSTSWFGSLDNSVRGESATQRQEGRTVPRTCSQFLAQAPAQNLLRRLAHYFSAHEVGGLAQRLLVSCN